jgi:DNA-directed RNA polymerase I, II, and III subunit RPABC2
MNQEFDDADNIERDDSSESGSETEKSVVKYGGDNDEESEPENDMDDASSFDANDEYKDNEDDEEEDEEDEEEDEEDEEEDEEEVEEEEENAKVTKRPKKSKPKKTMQLNMSDFEDDDEDEMEETYLQKFDNELNKNYIYEFHPECLKHNSDEIEKLSIVVRDEYNNIIDPLHKTLPYLTKYERARILGQRAKQIECGAKPFINVPENIIDGYIIAELELKEKKIPFIIKRPIPGGAFEYWNVKDLENIHF